MTLTWEIAALLFVAALSAGFIDAIAGGGGLITVPALLWAGLDPQAALATNKAQSVFGTAAAVVHYARSGLVKARELRLAVPVTFFAAAAGTWLVTRTGNELLAKIVPWLLLGVACYFLLCPRPGKARYHWNATAFALVAGAALGFYDGFFGPGTGAFWTLACVTLRGMILTNAVACTKVVNLTSNLASLLVFIFSGSIRYDVALVMIAGQLIGGRLGAGMAVRHGAPLIRVIFIAVVLAMTVKLLWDQFA